MKHGKRALPCKGSQNDWLNTFEPNERRYIETTLEDYGKLMRSLNSSKCRGSESLSVMKFRYNLFTCVSAGKLGDVRYLVCAERVE